MVQKEGPIECFKYFDLFAKFRYTYNMIYLLIDVMHGGVRVHNAPRLRREVDPGDHHPHVSHLLPQHGQQHDASFQRDTHPRYVQVYIGGEGLG